MRVGVQRHAPCALTPGKTRYPFYSGLGGPQGQPGRAWKISPPKRIRSRTVQRVDSRYTTKLSQPHTQKIVQYSKGVLLQAEVALGVPGRLRPRIISTLGTTRVVGRQPYAPAAFVPGEITVTHFQRLSRPQGTCFVGRNYGKNPQ